MEIGIVAFSFGLRTKEQEPNPSNRALADATEDAWQSSQYYRGAIVVSQWEITKALKQRYPSVPIAHSVELPTDGSYLGSKEVWGEAKKIFDSAGIDRVIIVAQPFLHLKSIKSMIQKDGFLVVYFPIQPIPFDSSKQNTQPWTRSRFRLFLYAVRIKLGLSHGHQGRQDAS